MASARSAWQTKFFKGTFQDPNMFFQMPMQMAVEREIHRYFRQQADLPTDTLEWDFEVKPFSHPALETASFIATYAGAFIFAAAMFNFVFAVSNDLPISFNFTNDLGCNNDRVAFRVHRLLEFDCLQLAFACSNNNHCFMSSYILSISYFRCF
jgi:hypothetical protein